MSNKINLKHNNVYYIIVFMNIKTESFAVTLILKIYLPRLISYLLYILIQVRKIVYVYIISKHFSNYLCKYENADTVVNLFCLMI